MPDYRIVKHPTKLKSQPLIETDVPTIPVGTGQTSVGMGRDCEPAQLDIVYTADNRTIVYPYKAPDGFEPWAFNGAVSPDDCVAWCRANAVKPAQAEG